MQLRRFAASVCELCGASKVVNSRVALCRIFTFALNTVGFGPHACAAATQRVRVQDRNSVRFRRLRAARPASIGRRYAAARAPHDRRGQVARGGHARRRHAFATTAVRVGGDGEVRVARAQSRACSVPASNDTRQHGPPLRGGGASYPARPAPRNAHEPAGEQKCWCYGL